MNLGRQIRSLTIAALALASLARAQIIDTTPTWDGVSHIAPFGQGVGQDAGDTPTYGQTFSAPAADSPLTSFTFWLDSVGGSGPSRFTGFVMEFDGARAVGPVLFEGAEFSLPVSQATFPYVPAFTPVTFDVPALALAPDRTYIAFISALPFFDAQDDTANVGFLEADVYDGGGFWFSNQATFDGLLGNDWETFIGGGTSDLAFRATFSTVPEPSAFGLAAVVALAVLVLARRRKRAAA